jgi:hypothetical protein
MISSGETPIETTTADAETLLTVPAGVTVRNVSIVNEGDAAGFFSDDGGETWSRLPAGPAAVNLAYPEGWSSEITIKRDEDASGSDLSGVYAFAW